MATLIDMSELRSIVGATDASRDAELLRQLQVATAQLESETGYLWLAREDYQRIEAPGPRRRLVWLPLLPVSSLTVSTRSAPEDEWEEREADVDYYLASEWVERLGGCWEPQVKLVTTGGYTGATTPADVKNAIALQIQFVGERFASGAIAATGRAIEGASVTFLGHPERGFSGQAIMHPEFLRVIERYRRRVIV